jgi:hypothetical protein
MKTSNSTLTVARVAMRTARDVLPDHARPKSTKKLVPVPAATKVSMLNTQYQIWVKRNPAAATPVDYATAIKLMTESDTDGSGAVSICPPPPAGYVYDCTANTMNFWHTVP